MEFTIIRGQFKGAIKCHVTEKEVKRIMKNKLGKDKKKRRTWAGQEVNHIAHWFHSLHRTLEQLKSMLTVYKVQLTGILLGNIYRTSRQEDYFNLVIPESRQLAGCSITTLSCT